MKKFSFLLPAILLMMVSISALSQKYKSPADTIKLNKKILEVSNEIADLSSKLTIAQNNLPGINNKANEAGADAQNKAIESSEQASNATNGSVRDAKKAKKKAKRAYKEAKDAEDAENKVKDQNKKIEKLSSQLEKKQKELQELDANLAALRIMPQ